MVAWQLSDIRFSRRTSRQISDNSKDSEPEFDNHDSLDNTAIHIPSDSSDFIEVQSIVKLQKSTRRVSWEPYRSPSEIGFAFVFIATRQTATAPWQTLQNDVRTAIITALSKMRLR
jgi:hypothetical protein